MLYCLHWLQLQASGTYEELIKYDAFSELTAQQLYLIRGETLSQLIN